MNTATAPSERSSKPIAWWRVPHMWLVVGGPLVVVVAAIITAVIAVRGADPVLNKEDFERDLKAATQPGRSGQGRRTDQAPAGQPGAQPRRLAGGSQGTLTGASPLQPPGGVCSVPVSTCSRGDDNMWAQRWMWIAWPAFLVAAVLEMLVFALVDPSELHWSGQRAGVVATDRLHGVVLCFLAGGHGIQCADHAAGDVAV